MSQHPVVDQLAQLVLDEPSITVAELAKKLGYAEQKSIYYWLDKAGFRSIRTFRDAVLTGRFPPVAPHWPAQLSEGYSPSSSELLPIMEVVSPGAVRPTGNTVGRGLRQRLSQQGFAYVLPSDDYAPLLLQGDLLLIEPTVTPRSGALVLAWSTTARVARLYRRYHGKDQYQHHHPVTGHSEGGNPIWLGLVVGSLRIFD